jgi:predicted unusual protein kinase regulating ubiquinone biosynthesis (AarF/ABC1/UbiB family)
MSAGRKVPEGRLGRFARLAAVGMRTGAGMLLDRDGTSTAQRAAEVLGNLRGLAAKMGQMASYVDGIVPEHHQDAFQSSMKVLRAAAPRSRPHEVRAAVESDLGAPIDDLFHEWDDEPLASASIGQVHRARLADGREVAVKVQHPGIAAAVESDLANAGIIETFAGAMGMKRFDTGAMLEVVRKRFREELDYALEADNIVHFARVHAGDPQVRVPVLVRERSGPRVLTTELVRGASFDDACAAAENERRAWATTMWRYVFRGNLVGGKFNADPHPGNYVFHDDGAITFLDYGCVHPIPEERLARAVRIHWAAINRDLPAFREAVSAMLDAKPGALEELARAYTRRCFEPLFDAPYRVTKEYAAALLAEMKDMAKVARAVDDAEFFSMPPDMLFINRLQFGFYSVLARLDVEVDYAAIERSFLPPLETLD